MLTSERLLIQPVSLKDSAFVYTLLNTEGWLRFIGDRGVNSLQDAEEYIRTILNNPESNFNVVRLRNTQEAIGMVSLMKRDFLDAQDIGYALLPGFEGKGYAFEAAQLYLNALSKVHASIYAFARAANGPSVKLLEKLGFRFVKSFLRDEEECVLYHWKKGTI